ncbi:hypothetical protein IWQ61_005523 [Dispira simplex]|nr:hypothetical protein IWQ61_005523 [Dispira simplex]
MNPADNETVTITYTDDFRIWPSIRDAFLSHTPLQHVICKLPPHTTTKFIPALPVNFVEWQNQGLTGSPLPSGLAATPYLNLYFSHCEDVDTYRQLVKAKIKQWLDPIASKKNQEWLIIHVTRQLPDNQAKSSGAKLFPRAMSVVDKIRADFSPKKDDNRVLLLHFGDDGHNDPETWNDVFVRIKECVVQSFYHRVTHYQEDVRRLDAQRMMPGWNYCTFFILKERVVHCYQQMGMYDEALKQYDELEASFFQLLKDRALTWFTSFGGTTVGDDNTSLLDFTKKEYRERIVQNHITVFDFRMYLFGRQCQLLIQLHQIREFLERCRKFVPSFKHAIEEFEKGLSTVFLTAWMFSTYKNVVDICETIPTPPIPTEAYDSAEIAAIKAEFLGNAKVQLDKLGFLFGILPESLEPVLQSSMAPTAGDQSCRYPKVSLDTTDVTLGMTSEKKGPSPSNLEEDRAVITNPELVHGLESQENFDNLYTAIINKAIRYCEDCKRFRFAQVLRRNLANLRFYRGLYDQAAELYATLLPPYVQYPPGSPLLTALLQAQGLCLRKLERWEPLFRLYYALLSGEPIILSDNQRMHYGLKLVHCSAQLPRKITWKNSRLFSIKVCSACDTPNHLGLTLKIQSQLQCVLSLNRIRVRMVSGETGHDLWFYSAPHAPISLTPGMNEIALYTHDSAPGIYTAEYAELLLHQVKFTYKLLEYNQKMTTRVNPHPLLPNVTVDWNPVQVQDYSADGPVFTVRLVAAATSCRAGSRLEVVPAEHVNKASLHRAHRGYYTSPTDSPALTRTNSLGSLLSTADLSRHSTPDPTPNLTSTASLWSEPADIMCQYFLRSVGRFAAVDVESQHSSAKDSPSNSTASPAMDVTTPDGKEPSTSCSPSIATSPVDQVRAQRILPGSGGKPVVLWLNLYANGQIQLPTLQPGEVMEVDFKADRRFVDLYEHTVTWATLAQYYVSCDPTSEGAALPLTASSQSNVMQPGPSSVVSFQRGLHTLSTRIPLNLGFSLQRQRQSGYLRVMVTTTDTVPVIIDGVELTPLSQVTPDENKGDGRTAAYPRTSISGSHIALSGYTIDSGAASLYRHYHQILLAGDSTVFTFKLTFNSPDEANCPTTSAVLNDPQHPMRSDRDLLRCTLHYRPLHEVVIHLANPYLDQALATAHHTSYTGLLRELFAKLLFHYTDLNRYCLEGKIVLRTGSGILPSSASTSTQSSANFGMKSLSHLGDLSQLPTVKAILTYELPDTQSVLLAILGDAVGHLEGLVGMVLTAKHEYSTGSVGGAVPPEVFASRTLKAVHRLVLARCISTLSMALAEAQGANEEPSASDQVFSIPMLQSTTGFPSFPLYPGQLLPITVTFTHQWNSAAGPVPEDLECGFQLRTGLEDWLVVGPQMGPLRVPCDDTSLRLLEAAEDAHSVPVSQTLELGLIPLRAGRLALPRFVVHMVSSRALDVMPITHHDYPCTHLEVLPAPGTFRLQLDYCTSVSSSL